MFMEFAIHVFLGAGESIELGFISGVSEPNSAAQI